MSFKYHVVEETYRDSRRMSVGEVWVTDEEIHNSRALYPADEATEEAYLKAFPEAKVSQIEHPKGLVNHQTGMPVMVPNRKYGHFTGRILADRKARKEQAETAAKESKMLPAPTKSERASDKL